MEREEGFYWVKWEGNWYPALHGQKLWYLAGMLAEFETDELDTIGPRIDPPKDAE
jgi:hypothetical protein